jgi:uncharacterized repeat protein (TIGR03803 family)
MQCIVTRWHQALAIAALPWALLSAPAGAASVDLVHTMVPGEPSALVQALTAHPNGKLYGVSAMGGHYRGKWLAGAGTVFELSPDGSVRILHDFDAVDALPLPTAMTLADDGHLYGSTAAGGEGGLHAGSLFRQRIDGRFETIYSFTAVVDAPSSYQPSALVQGRDGRLYGTTVWGPGGRGTLFSVATDGSGFTVLHQFDPATEGRPGLPSTSGLTVFRGELWGTAGAPTNGDGGVLFSVGVDGHYQERYRFPASRVPWNRLVAAPDGQLYGHFAASGRLFSGSVFRYAPDTGVVSDVHTFTRSGDEGRSPAPMTLGPDGRLYGATLFGAPGHKGAFYALATDGRLEVLAPIDRRDPVGFMPIAALTLGTDGQFYGLMSRGGAHDGNTRRSGSVYRLSLP